jgi:hypothetical protein
MARIDRIEQHLCIVAETDKETELIQFGQQHGGQLTLLEGLYSIASGRVVLPASISIGGAHRICEAVEKAAASHQRARQRRKSFRLVKSSSRR